MRVAATPVLDTLSPRLGGAPASPLRLATAANLRAVLSSQALRALPDQDIRSALARDFGVSTVAIQRNFGPARFPREELIWAYECIRDLPDALRKRVTMLRRCGLSDGRRADGGQLHGGQGYGCIDIFANYLTDPIYTAEFCDQADAELRFKLLLFHEMGHAFTSALIDDYAQMSGWQLTSKAGAKKPRFRFAGQEPPPTPYAKTSPQEDVAESVMLYRLNPQMLKSTAPRRYQWIQTKLFEGCEYDPKTLLTDYQKSRFLADTYYRSYLEGLLSSLQRRSAEERKPIVDDIQSLLARFDPNAADGREWL